MQASDLSQVLEIAREFVKQLDYEEAFDECFVQRVLQTCMQQGLAFVLADTKILGVILALSTMIPWSGSSIAHELMFYIMPEARGAGWSHRLLGMLERTCKKRGVRYLAMTSMVDLPADVVDSVYRQAGFEKSEIVWRKKL